MYFWQQTGTDISMMCYILRVSQSIKHFIKFFKISFASCSVDKLYTLLIICLCILLFKPSTQKTSSLISDSDSTYMDVISVALLHKHILAHIQKQA